MQGRTILNCSLERKNPNKMKHYRMDIKLLIDYMSHSIQNYLLLQSPSRTMLNKKGILLEQFIYLDRQDYQFKNGNISSPLMEKLIPSKV